MEEDIQILIGRLSGLEAARTAIEVEIADTHRRIGTLAGQMAVASPPKEKPSAPAPDDSTVLGHDILGRIKRKRNISPELREKKRKLIAEARAAKIAKRHAAHMTMVEPPVRAETPTTTKPVDEPGQH